MLIPRVMPVREVTFGNHGSPNNLGVRTIKKKDNHESLIALHIENMIDFYDSYGGNLGLIAYHG